MALYTISTNTNYDTLTSPAGNDTYTINSGATLTIDTDTRYCANRTLTTGNIGSVQIPGVATVEGGTLKLDGTNVRIIAYKTGSGNVPAIGTTVSQGGVSSYLLGVWSAFNVAPTAAGAAMPATGFIKIKNKTGGNFTDGALTGIGATAVGPDLPGWIEVVGVEATTINIYRTGSFVTTGEWFYPQLAVKTSTSITRVGTTATLTLTTHGVTTGSIVTISGASPSQYNGTYAVSNVTANTFDYTMASDPGSSASVQGDWVTQVCTSGTANQTVQLPASLATTYYPGVWIETAISSGVYEFYPSAGTMTNASGPTDAVRGKHVWISSQGLLRIGHDGTNTQGYLPTSGRKIRVPNIITIGVTSAAMQTNALNATLSTRYDFTTTNGGVVNIDKANLAWYPSFNQAYSVTVTNTGIMEALHLSEVGTSITLNNVGVGQAAATAQNALLVTSCFAGATITDCVWTRASLATTTYVNSILNVANFNFTRNVVKSFINHSSTTTGTWTITNALDSTWTDTTNVGGQALIVTGTNQTWSNTIFCNNFSGTTGTAQAHYAFQITTKSNTIVIDGLSFGGVANQQPYLGLVLFNTSDHLKIRNIGTPSSRLDLGSSNAAGLLLSVTTPSTDIEIKRVYLQNTRTATFISTANSDVGMYLQNVWGDAGDTLIGLNSLNTVYKGLYLQSAAPGAAYTSVYGNSFYDTFYSATRGKIGMLMNEASSSSPWAGSYTVDVGSPSFNSGGGLIMAASDQITFTWPWYVLGFTGFSSTNSEPPILSGATAATVRSVYDIDKNDGNGYSGSYTKNAFLACTGGSVSSNTTVTMTSTTNVAQGDYIWSSTAADFANGTTVSSVDNATTITVSQAATATGGSRTFYFSKLPAESVSATNGFKLRLRMIGVSGTSNTVTGHYFVGVTDATSQQTQYPLDYYDVVLQNIAVGSKYDIYNVTTSASLVQGTVPGTPGEFTEVTESVPVTVGNTLRVRVRNSPSQTLRYLPFETNATVASDGASVYISQVEDTIAA